MSYERDHLLSDLRENAIEVFYTAPNGVKQAVRCSLRPDLLPSTYIVEKETEKEFHETNPDLIAAWNLQKGGWIQVNINNVEYVQILDNYQ
jgi:hypothetical protein